jgi:hypothetical protein
MKTKTNKELVAFINNLSVKFFNAGDQENSLLLGQAAQNYIGSASEFLGEARNSLSKILSTRNNMFTETEINDLRGAIQSIDIAFKRANGLTDL